MYKVAKEIVATKIALQNTDPYLYKFINTIKIGKLTVNEVNIIEKNLINKIITKKIKNKLEIYLNYIITYIDTGDDEGNTNLRHALNDLTRYKSIIEYKYKKRLEPRYIELLTKKILLIENELKTNINLHEMNNYVEEETKGKSR